MNVVVQGANEIVIGAKPEQVWSVLEDSTLIPQWAPMIKQTTGKTERLNSTRTCQLEWDGHVGEVTERCFEAQPPRKIAWVQERGAITKLFSNFGFAFTLELQDGNNTLLRMEHFYESKSLRARLMSALMVRRGLKQLRQVLLNNLKDLIEERTAHTARA